MTFDHQEKIRLEKEMKEKALEQLSGSRDIVEYLDFTLKNFAYRYLESESTGELNPEWHFDDKSDSGCIEVIAFEDNLAQALKTKNALTRKGIISMASQFKKSDKPKVKYSLGIKWENLKSSPFKLVTYADVNWNHPEHSFESDLKHTMEKTFSYQDAFDMRNNFPKDLEEVCDIL
jgi:hypothetical protein